MRGYWRINDATRGLRQSRVSLLLTALYGAVLLLRGQVSPGLMGALPLATLTGESCRRSSEAMQGLFRRLISGLLLGIAGLSLIIVMSRHYDCLASRPDQFSTSHIGRS